MGTKEPLLGVDLEINIYFGVTNKIKDNNLTYPQELYNIFSISKEDSEFLRQFSKKFYNKYPSLKGKLFEKKSKVINLDKLNYDELFFNSLKIIVKDLFLLNLLYEVYKLKIDLGTKKIEESKALKKIDYLNKSLKSFFNFEGIIFKNKIYIKDELLELYNKHRKYYILLSNNGIVKFDKLKSIPLNKLFSRYNLNSSFASIFPFFSDIDKFLNFLSVILKIPLNDFKNNLVGRNLPIVDIINSLRNIGLENNELIFDFIFYYKNIEKIIYYFYDITYSVNSDIGTYTILSFDKREKEFLNILEAISNLKDLGKFLEQFEDKINIYSYFSSKLDDEILKLLVNQNIVSYKKLVSFYDLGFLEYLKSFPYKDKLKILEFIKNNYSLLKDYPKILNKLNLSYLDYLTEIKSRLSNEELAFLAENSLYGMDIEKLKEVYKLYKLGYDLKIIKNLELEDLKKITKNKLSNADVAKLKENNIDDILFEKKIHDFVEGYAKKIEIFKQLKILENECIFFEKELKKINKKNFNDIKTILDKKWIESFEHYYNKILNLQKNFSIDVDNIRLWIKLLKNKTSKSVKLSLKEVFSIIEYILGSYDEKEVNYLRKILLNDKVYLSNEFKYNYKHILKGLVDNRFFLNLEDVTGKTSLSNLVELVKYEDIKNNLLTRFSDALTYLILENYGQSTLLYKILTIENILQNGTNEDFYMNLLALEEEQLKRYYFLIKNFSIIGINIKAKYEEIFNFVEKNNFTEEKLKELKSLIRKKTISEPDFFYELFLEYVSDKNIDVSIFGVLFEDENKVESDEIFEKNTGIKGLGGFSGKEVLKKLQRLGWKIKKVNGRIQGKGDHVLLYKEENGKKIYTMIPFHSQLKAKTLFDTLNRAKIRKEKFLSIK